MEQQQFKVSFSLGTKLLLSILLLLIVVIGFLNASTIFILTDDKRAYIYQAQNTEATLAGREFLNSVRHSFDTLRLSLANTDPLQASSQKQTAALRSVLDNQSDLIFESVSLINPSTGAIQSQTSVSKMEQLKEESLSSQTLELQSETLKPVLPELLNAGHALINVSRPGSSPLVGILFADTKGKSAGAVIPVGFGILSLRDFGNGLNGLNITVATSAGRVLFDHDSNLILNKTDLRGDPLFQSTLKSTLNSGATEFEINEERYLGSYVRPGLDILVLNKTEWKKAIRSAYTLSAKFIVLGIIAISIAALFAFFFSKSLTSPINKLYEATREVAKGNFDLKIKPSGKDEIGALTSSFNVMSQKISGLIRESMEKVQLENEIAIASTVQQRLIPPEFFKSDQILIESRYQSASQCGGDWWGFFGVGKKFVVMIADATGHGFPSALMTASSRSCFSVMHKLAQEDPSFSFSPSAMLSYANRVIYDAALSQIMMTFFIGVIDFETGKLTYSSAGHNPPWLLKKDGETYKLNSLIAEGQRLGERRDAPSFAEKEISISSGDLLFLYTDGIIEGKNKSGEMFTKKRVRKIVEASASEGPQKVATELMTDFLKHNSEKALDDDVTIVAASIL